MAFKNVDIDAHVAEPITEVMNEYLDPAFKDRPMRLRNDEKGHEYLEIDGRKSTIVQGGCGMGLEAGKGFGTPAEELLPFFTPGEVHYYDGLIPEGFDPHARIKWMDKEGVDLALQYPTLGLFWEADCPDPKAAAAYCRAYNDWLFDFCKPYPDRLFPVAHIPTLDVQEAVKEIKRTAKLGAKAFMVFHEPPSRHQVGDPYFDPMYAEAEDLGIPVTPHPANALPYMGMDPRGKGESDFLTDFWFTTQVTALPMMLNLVSMVSRGTFDRFPRLKYVFLETGASWVHYWLERMDDRWEREHTVCGFKLRPSEYFQRNCWISFEPEEEMIPQVIERWGSDKFFWATDFPHHDGYPGVLGRVKKLISPLSEKDQKLVLGDSAMKLYNLA